MTGSLLGFLPLSSLLRRPCRRNAFCSRKDEPCISGVFQAGRMVNSIVLIRRGARDPVASEWEMELNQNRGIRVARSFFLCTLFLVGLSSHAQAVCTEDPDNPLVGFETSLGHFYVELCGADSSVATTVDNFLDYVESGAYTNTGFIHRALNLQDSGSFGIIQGGGYFIQNGLAEVVVTNPPIPLQAVLSNLRGTIAMARTNDPNSATSQWFINTEDNLIFDPAPGQDGYAVFGRVILDGLDVVDDIVDQEKWNLNPSSFPSVPLIDYPNDGSSVLSYLVYVTDVYVVPEPSATLQMMSGIFALMGFHKIRGAKRKAAERSRQDGD